MVSLHISTIADSQKQGNIHGLKLKYICTVMQMNGLYTSLSQTAELMEHEIPAKNTQIRKGVNICTSDPSKTRIKSTSSKTGTIFFNW